MSIVENGDSSKSHFLEKPMGGLLENIDFLMKCFFGPANPFRIGNCTEISLGAIAEATTPGFGKMERLIWDTVSGYGTKSEYSKCV